MALEILYSPQFSDNLESILRYFEERNSSDRYSKKLMKMIHKQIRLLSSMPEIGRLSNYPNVRILFVDRYGIVYQIREKSILVVDIYSCQTDPDKQLFRKL